MVKVKVIFDYDATQPDELTIKSGEIINDVKKMQGGWWEGMLNGKRGLFPDNFVEDYIPPNEPTKGPKPGGGKVSEVQQMIGGQIKLGPPPPKSKSKQMAVVLFEYKPEQPDELELNEGDEVEIVRMAEEGWWEGVLRNKTGMFPSNFVKLLDSPPPAPSPNYPSGGRKPHDSVDHRPPPGGRPPAEKPKMPPPGSSSMDANPPPQLPKRNRGVKARVVYSYQAQNEDELSLTEGQIILVTDQKLEDAGWWKGELNGRPGVFPDNFVELLPDEEPSQPPPTHAMHQQPIRGAAPREPSVRINKPPPQLPPEPEHPAKLPPRPGSNKMEMNAEPHRGPTPPMSKPEPPKSQMHMQAVGYPVGMVNGDDKAMLHIREELEKIKSSMVSRESYEILQRELKATKESLESYKKENNKKIIDLMKEIDEGKKMGIQNNIELARIRKLAEDHFVSK